MRYTRARGMLPHRDGGVRPREACRNSHSARRISQVEPTSVWQGESHLRRPGALGLRSVDRLREGTMLPSPVRSVRALRVAAVFGASLIAFGPASAQAPRASDGLASAARALALIDSAIAAHGGTDRLRAVEDLTIRYRGRRWMVYQSPTLARPWATQPTFADGVLDFKNNRLMQTREIRYPVDFVFSSTQITTPQQSWFWNPKRTGLGDAVVKFPGAPVATNPNRRELPAF